MTNSLTISALILAAVFGGALLGMLLRRLLPDRHLTTESKEIVLVGIGLVATMAAVVLGLLIGSAKASYDKQRDGVLEMAANALLLDRVLAHYGPDARPARELLQRTLDASIDQIWRRGAAASPQAQPLSATGERLFDAVVELKPASEAQGKMREEAASICAEIGRTRLLLFAQSGRSIALPLVIVLAAWITIVFIGVGLFAPANGTVIVTLFLCAVSVSGAISLTLELDQPFTGLIQISDAPVRAAIEHIGR